MKVNIFWFRRDLRLDDNHGLFQALSQNDKVIPIFIFDEEILSKLADKNDKRVTFIYQALEKINKKLKKVESGIDLYFGKPKEIFEQIIQKYDVDLVFTNEDYEPYALKRDTEIREFLESKILVLNLLKIRLFFHQQRF